MTPELKQQIEDDMKLAQLMADIATAEGVLALTARLIDYMRLIEESQAELEYKATQLKNKCRVLKDYYQLGKQRHKELSILEYSASK